MRSLAGTRYERKGASPYRRHGSNPGSVRLGGQRHRVRVPRLRGPEGEVRLTSYAQLHARGDVDETLLRWVLYGISCRNYEVAAEALPGRAGMSIQSQSVPLRLAMRPTPTVQVHGRDCPSAARQGAGRKCGRRGADI